MDRWLADLSNGGNGLIDEDWLVRTMRLAAEKLPTPDLNYNFAIYEP